MIHPVERTVQAARALVTDLDQPRNLHLLAWLALKTARGESVNQTRLRMLQRRQPAHTA